MRVLRDAVQGKTLCHALVGLHDQEGFSSTDVTHLLQMLKEDFLRECMECQDFLGSTPLHCAIEANNASTDVIKFLLRFSTCKSVMIMNNDSLTPLEWSYDKKLWPITKVLIEYHIETGASCAAELLQEYIFKSITEEGGNVFLPWLLEIREHYCPDLNLNFRESRSNRTPWWYLAISNDVNVMTRVVQALKDHSIEFTNLQIRTECGKNLVEEAADNNQYLFTLIQNVTKLQHSEESFEIPEEANARHISSSESDLEQIGCHGSTNPAHPFPTVMETSETSRNIVQEDVESTKELPPPITQLTESGSSTSTESSSERDLTSIEFEADDSSDCGSEGVLSKVKRPTKHKKTTSVMQRCCRVAARAKKNSMVVVCQHSGYLE